MFVYLFLPQKELLPAQSTMPGTGFATWMCMRPQFGRGGVGWPYKLASKVRTFEAVKGSNNYMHIRYKPGCVQGHRVYAGYIHSLYRELWGHKGGRANSVVGEGHPFRVGFLDEAMLANYWTFDIHPEDNGERACPIPGVLQTQHNSRQLLSLQRGDANPRRLLPAHSASGRGFVLCRGLVLGRCCSTYHCPLSSRHCRRRWEYHGHDRQIPALSDVV